MHLSQLLACALLLTLLSLRPSDAKPGEPPKVPRAPHGRQPAGCQPANEKRGDKTPSDGGANLKSDRSRLLRDLHVDTKARAARARRLQEQPRPRRYSSSSTKKIPSQGCFGLKLDRIGALSGLGC
ncbi:C-type natriuretic peptide [Sorex fumeus]|uniref:C-type natriuretic peptide n=1 Tax=Sorex fumeus TaxID=62283 RepID=UPI0024ADB992|nr:C-type natriuretic peptide [Sorex fumeus]